MSPTMSQLKDVGCYNYSPWRFLGRKERCDKGWGHIGPHRGRHTHKRWVESCRPECYGASDPHLHTDGTVYGSRVGWLR